MRMINPVLPSRHQSACGDVFVPSVIEKESIERD